MALATRPRLMITLPMSPRAVRLRPQRLLVPARPHRDGPPRASETIWETTYPTTRSVMSLLLTIPPHGVNLALRHFENKLPRRRTLRAASAPARSVALPCGASRRPFSLSISMERRLLAGVVPTNLLDVTAVPLSAVATSTREPAASFIYSGEADLHRHRITILSHPSGTCPSSLPLPCP